MAGRRRVELELRNVIEVDPPLAVHAAVVGLVGFLGKLDQGPVGVGGADFVDLDDVAGRGIKAGVGEPVIIGEPSLVKRVGFEEAGFIRAPGRSEGERERTKDSKKEFGHELVVGEAEGGREGKIVGNP